MDRFALIKMRLQVGLKQWELARLLIMSQTALCDLEKGRRAITPDIEDKVRKAIHDANRTHETGNGGGVGQTHER